MRSHYPIELARQRSAEHQTTVIRDQHQRLKGTSLTWLAGLLEGEGSFALVNSPEHYAYAQVIVAMTDEDVIVHAARLMGSGVQTLKTPTKTGKTIYRTAAKGKRAVSLMVLLLPYMGERRAAKIREVLGQIPVDQHVLVARPDRKRQYRQLRF